MGLTQSLAAGMAKQQQEAQRGMIARQLEMQQAMRERVVATQLAFARDQFMFYGTFWALAVVGLPIIALKRKSVGFVMPLVPLTFVAAYQADMAYGGKMERVIAEADRILANEAELLALPGGPLTLDELDASARRRSLQSSDLEPVKI
jgi:uncharacterized iron-regulated protein